LKITLLGTGTTIPHKRRNAPGLLIECNGCDEYLLFDCGSGILRQLARVDIDFRKITYVFLSHLHADHISDLPLLLKANFLYHNPQRINIFGPSSTNIKLEKWLTEIYPYLEKVLKNIKIQELNECNLMKRGNWEVQAFPVNHGIEAYGFRIRVHDKLVVYSGDTGFTQTLIQAAENADFLINECSYPSVQKTSGHCTPKEVGEIAHSAHVKQLVLTHFYPVCDGREAEMLKEIKELYSGEIIWGEDLMELKL